ncbi:complement C3-like [Gastrophryne carolinensis]
MAATAMIPDGEGGPPRPSAEAPPDIPVLLRPGEEELVPGPLRPLEGEKIPSWMPAGSVGAQDKMAPASLRPAGAGAAPDCDRRGPGEGSSELRSSQPMPASTGGLIHGSPAPGPSTLKNGGKEGESSSRAQHVSVTAAQVHWQPGESQSSLMTAEAAIKGKAAKSSLPLVQPHSPTQSPESELIMPAPDPRAVFCPPSPMLDHGKQPGEPHSCIMAAEAAIKVMAAKLTLPSGQSHSPTQALRGDPTTPAADLHEECYPSTPRPAWERGPAFSPGPYSPAPMSRSWESRSPTPDGHPMICEDTAPPGALSPGALISVIMESVRRNVADAIKSLPSRADFESYISRMEGTFRREITSMQNTIADLSDKVETNTATQSDIQTRVTALEQERDATRRMLSTLQGVGNTPRDLSQMRRYIAASGMPRLEGEAVNGLGEPISSTELHQAIKASPNGRSPGPDGLTIAYYKKFESILNKHFLQAFNATAGDDEPGLLPTEALEAHVTVIHKAGKDPLSCKSYRPISLLNVDLKLFTKILANRLAIYLPNLIDGDQCGFIPGREARDNTIRTLNLIHRSRTDNSPMMLLSTDAEKAFDRVDWNFVFEVLRHIGLQGRALKYILGIYSTPQARVKVNGHLSPPFRIANGTRQGCPLSPLIFALVVEPFLRHVRNNTDLKGIHVKGVEHKVSAYADDLLFFISSPAIGLPVLMKEFETFGNLSNFKINFDKSEALNVGLPDAVMSPIRSSFPFRWTPSALTYLGTKIPSDIGEVFSGKCALITPHILRVDTEETIIVDAQLQSKDFKAFILVHDFPERKLELVRSEIHINSTHNYIGTVTIKVPGNHFKDSKKKQYVSVEVSSNECQLRKVVLLSFHTGYIFVQTDKPIYNPGTPVKYRLFVTGHALQPDNRFVDLEILNPDGIVVKKDKLSSGPNVGIIERKFDLPEIASEGIWKITCRFQTFQQEKFYTDFEVKEYVLPSFEVLLETPQNHYYVDDSDFKVDISANFLHGKPVEGTGHAIFGVMHNDEKITLPGSLVNITVVNGKSEAKLERYMITQRYRDLSFLVGKSLYVSVTVLTNAGSDIVEVQKTGIPVVETAFKMIFTQTSKYFKPGIPYSFRVVLQNPDSSPASDIKICTKDSLCDTTNEDGIAEIIINNKPGIQQLSIHVRTEATYIPDRRQTSSCFTVIAYKGANYLNIQLTSDKVKLGDTLSVQFHVLVNPAHDASIKRIIYMIISKGQVIKTDSVERFTGQNTIVTNLVVTRELIPSFRFVAYYVLFGSTTEIVSDAVLVDSVNSNKQQVELTLDSRTAVSDPQPGTSVDLKLTGEPGAAVGLAAIDKAVLVLNKKNRLTQNKIWKEVERSDLGCTPGGGKDSAGVFTDAGLSVETNMGLSNPTRTAQQYKDTNLRKCCEDGMKENVMGYSCQRRSEFVLEQGQCVMVFLECCKFIFEPERRRVVMKPRVQKFSLVRPGSRIISTGVAEALDPDAYEPMEDIKSRSFFSESWLWKTEVLPTRTDSSGLASKTFKAHLPESITTWEIQAISLSPTSGISVAKPLEMMVKKQFFIDMRLPYSAVRNEQVEIHAVLYSYVDTEFEAAVDLIHNEKMCSAAKKGANFRQMVKMEPGGTLVLPFVIVPLVADDITIEIKASSNLYLTDGVIKRLKVVPEGLRILKYIQSVILAPQRSADASGSQVVTINTMPPNDIVPNTQPQVYVSVKGGLLGETLENSIDGSKLKHLITVPSGCGEQIMMSMTPTVIAIRFLDATNQWEAIGLQRRAEAIKNVEHGYAQQMTYRQPDDSYSAFTNRPGSTWLTAYVVKVFAMASRMMNVEKERLCGAITWLLSKKQQPNGSFKEDAPVIHGEMVGGTGNTDPDTSLAAFVLIALVEAKSLCEKEVPDLQSGLDKTATFLQNQYNSLKRPYTICITSYALSLVGKLNDHWQLLKSSSDGNRWADYSSDLYSIESTSYALLALLNLKLYIMAEPVARWLTEQRFYGGGYGSTQATIMVFQALSEYQTHLPQMNEINLDVTLSLPGRKDSVTWRITTDDSILQRSEQTAMKDKITVSASGQGQGTLTVMSMYYAPLAEGVVPCKNFDFNVTLEEVPKSVKKPIGVKKSMYLNICMRYLGSQDATMTVVDVTLLTGFTPDTNDLEALTNRVDKYISKYEKDTERSERGSIIIYLDKVSSKEKDCLKFRIHQNFEVGILQPATVAIYEYYSMGNTCTKFYHPTEEGGELRKICREAECHCISERCNLKNVYEGPTDALSRAKEACLPGVDYVYETKVNKIENQGAYDVFYMTVTRVVKLGTDEITHKDERQFYSHTGCRDSLKVQVGRSYIIWGRSEDIWNMKNEKSYVINGGTWLEIIPTKRECQTTKADACEEIENFIDHMVQNGCSN